MSDAENVIVSAKSRKYMVITVWIRIAKTRRVVHEFFPADEEATLFDGLNVLGNVCEVWTIKRPCKYVVPKPKNVEVVEKKRGEDVLICYDDNFALLEFFSEDYSRRTGRFV